jgi:hypothetical protein
MFVRSVFALWVRYWFVYYVFWFNVYVMNQILILILYLLAQCLYYGLLIQCLYYEADTGSYGMVVRSKFVLWGRYWFLYYVFWFKCLNYEEMPAYFRTCLKCLECRVKMFFDSTLADFRHC